MKSKLIITATLLGALIAGCGPSATPAAPTPDVAAVRTSAASTVIAQFTLTAAVFTPTPSLPTETSLLEATATATIQPAIVQATNAETTTTDQPCDLLGYDPLTVDVNVPDGAFVTPGQEFIKTWRVKNNGPCPWGAGYVLVYAGYANQMSGQFIALTEVIQQGQEVELSVQFKAPNTAGEYLSAWTMRNPQGFTFPEVVFVKIIVQ